MKGKISNHTPTLTLPLLLLLALSAMAKDDASDYLYTTTTNGICITQYIGTDTVVKIPDKIDGLPVVEIQWPGFVIGCSPFPIESVTIGKNVEIIGEFTFADQEYLTNAVVGDSVRFIGGVSFAGCSSLRTVSIGKSLEYIGGLAFFECFTLTTLTLKGDAPLLDWGVFYLDSYGDYNDHRCPATVYYHPQTAGWGPTFGDLPTVPWNERNRVE